jgi:predicted ATP-binding protein involved in virulence
MKVKRLKMTSFRGINDLTLEFDDTEPTVLIGINGVGKSSILDCLAILLSWLLARIQFAPEVKDPFRVIQVQPVVMRQGQLIQQPQEVKDGRYLSEQDIRNQHNYTDNKIWISLKQLAELQWSISKVRKQDSENPSYELGELEQVTTDIRSQWKANPEANIPLVVYYPVNRAVLDIPLEIPEEYLFKQVDAYEQALNGVQVSFASFFQWFRALEDLENEERRDNPDYRNQQLEAVRQAIYSLLEGFSTLRVRRSPLRMTVTKQGQELIVNQLSDGEKGLLAMVGDLARRLAIANPSLSDPLQGSGVVLIDEIELHLHPKWQREIIPALTRTFPNCQFIVTTHSPQVISEVKPEGIYILERTDNGIVAMRPESSYGRDSNRILEDLMDTPERPQEIKESLLELFRLIAKGDLDSARQLHQKIADEIGADEPELVGANVSIRRREILGR